jgi:hypothetical protein
MLKDCSQTVEMPGTNLAQLSDLCALCTAKAKYLATQVFLYGLAGTAYEQLSSLFTQAFLVILSLLSLFFYTLSPRPIVTTKYKLIRISI